MIELSREEELAIASLNRLAKRWPDTLLLFVDGSSLCVMKKNKDGDIHTSDGAPGQDYVIESINISAGSGQF